ncbi:hypothetical protein BGZ65_005287 [Modicella reniformis]|uniref:Uncharacterized protein n=1 Tax=Modicella reniformis TaxID=1440133 RepID=A0A9P6M2L2_9FUNG|nr:hypothetical protein BGZ65_005287 [Modicella reniformis]
MALLNHIPRTLQDMEFDVHIDRNQSQAHIATSTITSTIPLQLSHPTRLRRLSFNTSLMNCEDLLLISLLKQSPLLEHLKLPRIDEIAFVDGVIPTLIGHCPKLQSFHINLGSIDWFHNVCILLEAYPNGLRYLTVSCSWYYNPNPVESSAGALVKALLKYSTNTIEVLDLSGTMGNWIEGVASVLEQCPNLRVLSIRGSFLSLDDIIHATSWKMTVLEPTLSGSREPSCLVLSPWACTKLEELRLYIEKPQFTYLMFVLRQQRRNLGQETNSMFEELVISIILQVGVLWKKLKSVRSLKTQSILWDPDMILAIQTMSFDRGVFYMSHIGLSGIRHQDMVLMGIDWETIGERQRKERNVKLDQIALQERTGLDRRLVPAGDDDGEYDKPWVEDLEVDWPLDVDRKKFHKSGKLYLRQSLRSSAHWFDAYPKK